MINILKQLKKRILKRILYFKNDKRSIFFVLYSCVFIFMFFIMIDVSMNLVVKFNEYLYHKDLVLNNILIYGNNYIDDLYIKEELNSFLDGKNILQVKKRDVFSKLDDIKMLDKFSFSKDLKGDLKIRFIENVPFAIWKNKFIKCNGDIIDNIFEKYHKIDVKRFIIISAENLNNISSISEPLLKYPDILSRVKILKQISDGRSWNLILKNNILVKLPPTNIERSFIRLRKLQESVKIMDQDENLQYIDLRVKDKKFIGLKDKNKLTLASK